MAAFNALETVKAAVSDMLKTVRKDYFGNVIKAFFAEFIARKTEKAVADIFSTLFKNKSLGILGKLKVTFGFHRLDGLVENASFM